MGKDRGGQTFNVGECAVCGQPGQRLLLGVSQDHDLCRRLVKVEEGLAGLEARAVEWRTREARATGELLERVTAMEPRAFLGMDWESAEQLEKACREWVDKHTRADIDRALEILKGMGYGPKGNGQGGPEA